VQAVQTKRDASGELQLFGERGRGTW
jgi:hypothetical protein